jgi:hypothetical protein
MRHTMRFLPAGVIAAGCTLVATWSLAGGGSAGAASTATADKAKEPAVSRTTSSSAATAPSGSVAAGDAASKTKPDLPEHPMTIGKGSKVFVIAPIPEAPMGKKIKPSELVGRSGYDPPEDPERDSVERGRRVANDINIELTDGFLSLEALVGEALIGAKTKDVNVLQHLRISFDEFKQICWPEFPASRPGPEVPVTDPWLFLDHSCNAGIGKGIHEIAGRDLVATGARFDPGVKRYRNFNLYDGLIVTACPREGGSPVEIKFLGTVIERNGRYKIYCYKD